MEELAEQIGENIIVKNRYGENLSRVERKLFHV
jgi:hypothetical protein